MTIHTIIIILGGDTLQPMILLLLNLIRRTIACDSDGKNRSSPLTVSRKLVLITSMRVSPVERNQQKPSADRR